jgi:translation initiation factor IF-2
MPEERVGTVTHFFGKILVAGIEITEGSLSVGDTIRIKGHTTDLTQRVDSMQVENESVETARPGQSVGIKLVDRARVHDEVYRVVPD